MSDIPTWILFSRFMGGTLHYIFFFEAGSAPRGVGWCMLVLLGAGKTYQSPEPHISNEVIRSRCVISDKIWQVDARVPLLTIKRFATQSLLSQVGGLQVHSSWFKLCMLQSKPTEKNSTTHLKDKKVDQQETYFFTFFLFFIQFLPQILTVLDTVVLSWDWWRRCFSTESGASTTICQSLNGSMKWC